MFISHETFIKTTLNNQGGSHTKKIILLIYQKPFLFICLVRNTTINIPCIIVNPLKIGELNEMKKAVSIISSKNTKIIIANNVC